MPFRAGVLATAAVLVGVLAPRLHAVTAPLQPVDGSVVATQNPTFVVSVTFTGDPFATIVVSSSAGSVGSCSPQTPVGPTGEQNGTFGCELPDPLPPGTYSWRAQYPLPVCPVVDCPSPQTVQGPFSFTVSATATAHVVPARLQSLVVSPTLAKPGGSLSVTAALWIGGSPQPVEAVACRTTAELRANAVKRGDRGACRWTLPRTLRTGTVRGTITLSGGTSAKAGLPFSVRVRR